MARGRTHDLTWVTPIIAGLGAFLLFGNWAAAAIGGLGVALVMMAIDAVRGGVGPH